MTPLRQRMLDAMTVRGLAERTQECYVDAVAHLARHYHRSPELLSASEVEAYLLHLVKDRKLSYSSVNHASSASRFLFEKVLGRPADIAHLRPPMARVPQKQPQLLAREEIARLLACCAHPTYRMLLTTLYASGLRVGEACRLRMDDIDSTSDRMCLRIQAGKGGHAGARRGRTAQGAAVKSCRINPSSPHLKYRVHEMTVARRAGLRWWGLTQQDKRRMQGQRGPLDDAQTHQQAQMGNLHTA